MRQTCESRRRTPLHTQQSNHTKSLSTQCCLACKILHDDPLLVAVQTNKHRRNITAAPPAKLHCTCTAGCVDGQNPKIATLANNVANNDANTQPMHFDKYWSSIHQCIFIPSNPQFVSICTLKLKV